MERGKKRERDGGRERPWIFALEFLECFRPAILCVLLCSIVPCMGVRCIDETERDRERQTESARARKIARARSARASKRACVRQREREKEREEGTECVCLCV